MQISDKKVVSIHYHLTDDSGEVIDSSEGQDPLTYLHGAGGLIPGLEEELEGKSAGDQLTVSVSPDKGYGEFQDSLVQTVPLEIFEGVESVEVGMQFQTSEENGSSRLISVTDVQGDQVTVDGNHPLAGMSLNFDVTVVAVRDATPEELDHGHAH